MNGTKGLRVRLLCCLLAALLCAACPALAADRALSRFELYRHGEMAYDSYDLDTQDGRLRLSVNGGRFRPVDDSVGQALLEVIDRYDMAAWDGFDRSNPYVLDGEGFRVGFELTDGTSALAIGDNAFPDHYFDAVGEIEAILQDAASASPLAGIRRFLSGLFSPKDQARVVGADIPGGDIHDFYYTYASSTFPPEYQRYRFYLEDGAPRFFHERREGKEFPLTEAHATLSGTLELTDAQWARFLDSIAGGTVSARDEEPVDGDAGPWMYVYYEGDAGLYQEYRFPSYGAQLEFEAMCASLTEG